MKSHDTNDNNSVGRRPGGLWCLGTTGCLVGLLYLAVALARRMKGERTVEDTETSARTLLVLDTAASSKDLTVRVGPGHPLVRLPESDTYMITPRKISHLAERALAHKSTRRYGEKLRRLPDGSTEGGAGGFPIVALTAGLADLPTIDPLIRDRILQQRDRSVIDRQHAAGDSFDLSKRGLQIIVGNGSGGTNPGLALLFSVKTLWTSNIRPEASVL